MGWCCWYVQLDSKSVWTKNNATIFRGHPTVSKGSRLLWPTCRKTRKDMRAHMQCWNKSHVCSHLRKRVTSAVCTIQRSKSKQHNICTQIQTTQSAHAPWHNKHDKEQTTLIDMQKSNTWPLHESVLVLLTVSDAPFLVVKTTKTFSVVQARVNHPNVFWVVRITLWELMSLPKYHYHLKLFSVSLYSMWKGKPNKIAILSLLKCSHASEQWH